MTGVILILLGALTLALIFTRTVWLPRREQAEEEGLLTLIGTAIELRAPRHLGRMARIEALCEVAAETLRLPPDQVRRLRLSARVRDIGLAAIPYDLLNGPPGSLDPAEEALYARHAEIGAAMLEAIPSLKEYAPVVRDHTHPPPGAPIEVRLLHLVEGYVERTGEFGLARAEAWAREQLAFHPDLYGVLPLAHDVRDVAPQRVL